jgi:phage terminase small subunit
MARNTTGAKPGKERKPKTTSGPVTKVTELNEKQKRFVDEYLVDLNGTQAAIRTGYAAGSADVTAARLLGDARVQAYLQQRMADLAQRTEITQEMVLERWWKIATADPNELIQYRRLCCRYCFGNDHAYQWIDEDEYEAACRAAKAEERRMPTDEGGYGFDHAERPHPKCPQCHGEGRGDVFVHDTRDLKGSAKMLYDGVKITKNGLEVLTLSREKALENVARHLGMFKLDVNHGVEEGNPLLELLTQLSGKTLKPVAE